MTEQAVSDRPVSIERRHGDWRLVARQVRYEQRAFWRNKVRAFFVFLLPIMFLLIFASLMGNDPTDVGQGEKVRYVTFFVPGMLAFAIVGSTFSNLAIGLAYLRQLGILKRVQGTPLPRWVYLTGVIGGAVITTLQLTALVLVIGKLLYDVDVRLATLPAFLAMVVLGTAAFSALGVAITAIIPNGDAAPAVTNAAVLPLSFFSGVWFPIDDAPAWVGTVAGLFPLRPFAHSLQHAFFPFSDAPGFVTSDVVRLVLWLVVGVLISFRWFRWTDSRQ
jgi:ABC-2 type transport system permease protein